MYVSTVALETSANLYMYLLLLSELVDDPGCLLIPAPYEKTSHMNVHNIYIQNLMLM